MSRKAESRPTTTQVSATEVPCHFLTPGIEFWSVFLASVSSLDILGNPASPQSYRDIEEDHHGNRAKAGTW